MVQVRIKKTGQVKEVTRNIAHDLIEKGQAELVTKTPPKAPLGYQTGQMRPAASKATK